MTGLTYRTTMSNSWNVDRRGVLELDAVARAFLGDEEITDRDRIAFAAMGSIEADAVPRPARHFWRYAATGYGPTQAEAPLEFTSL